MFAKKTAFLFILAFCLTTSCFAEDPVEIQLAEQAIWKHKLSVDGQAIVDSLNVKRSLGEIDSFEVNVKLSKAIKDKAENIIISHVDTDTISIENKLVDFMSHFGDKAYVFKGSSKIDILDHISLNEILQTEISDESNVLLSISCVEDTLRDSLYLLLYISEYQITFGAWETTIPKLMRKGDPITNIRKIRGVTNGKYLMYKFYEGTALPFYYEGNKMLTEELRTKEDGSFSFELSYSGYGSERRRIAIFVRNDPEEPYSLVDFFPVLGGISR